ncbi:MAG: acyl-CoA thioesterase [Muribaculum sp.]|nr:acyl-CoA thioesterase [Muribaculaceae bacterium]MCM1081451.1 acyl-CoA thioesterase [Muribaculum sp.]
MKKYIFELPMKVRDYEVDVEGIVNNANYLHYMEHTRHEFCNAAGMSFRDMHLQGIDPVVCRVEIDYRTPLGLGEEFVSCLNMVREGARFIFFQDIYNMAGRPVVKGKISVVSTVGGKLTRGDELAAFFTDYL